MRISGLLLCTFLSHEVFTYVSKLYDLLNQASQNKKCKNY